MLETEVEEKYYLTDKQTDNFVSVSEREREEFA